MARTRLKETWRVCSRPYGIIDKNSKKFVSYKYTAYGVPTIEIPSHLTTIELSIAQTVSELNIYLYKGYIYDQETGLYYCQTRYYNPHIARWISIDSIDYLDPNCINGLNLYAYCGNNPVMLMDGDGNSPTWWNPFSWFDNVSNVGKIVIGGILFVGAVALTIATGGALAPVFIGTAVGVGAGTLIGGFSSVIGSGGDWSQFGQGAWDGFSDGVLWGGIFAFASASIGTIKYAAKGSQGALQGTTKMTTITKGQQFDRFGSVHGKFITDVGTSSSRLALPATNSGAKITLQATKNFRVFTGTIAPGFGSAGGGTQYVMRYSIETLLKKGWIVLL